tara:strand:+ start:1430 stop:1669 length:240 start_codon:yes stop_codon:yes gene_type:complete
MDEKYYNIGDLIKFSEYGRDTLGFVGGGMGLDAIVNKLGIIISTLKPNVGGLVGYSVKFPQFDPIFLAISEIELVKAIN